MKMDIQCGLYGDKEKENDTRNPITKAFDSTYGECLRFIVGVFLLIVN